MFNEIIGLYQYHMVPQELRNKSKVQYLLPYFFAGLSVISQTVSLSSPSLLAISTASALW